MWTHKKFKYKKFVGSYSTHRNERVFELTCYKENGDVDRRITFESWQLAKANGWKLS